MEILRVISKWRIPILYTCSFVLAALSLYMSCYVHYSYDGDGSQMTDYGKENYHEGLWTRCYQGSCYDLSTSKLRAARFFIICDHITCVFLLITLVVSVVKHDNLLLPRILAVTSVLHTVLLVLGLSFVTSQVRDDRFMSASWGEEIPWVGWVLSLPLIATTIAIAYFSQLNTRTLTEVKYSRNTTVKQSDAEELCASQQIEIES
ncbi:uncharacterized protein LOC142343990 [Convolutriloba macropyga]|uniref:uncharacterized protein LOC142343990 n=1 Tax=Convolutriloba macropyga TaxID=536237 RepID=UPI003F52772F